MLSLIRSELLKMRHTFSLKLVILAPIVTLLLGYLLSGNSVQFAAYNWWYTMILPIAIAIWGANIITCETRTHYQNVLCLSVELSKIWISKFLTVGLLLLMSNLIMWCGCTIFGFFTDMNVSILNGFIGCFLLTLTFLWQISITMIIAKRAGYLAAILFSFGSNILLSPIGSKNNLFFLNLYAIPSRIVCPFFKIQPNGIPLEQGSVLLENTNIVLALFVSLFACVFMLIIMAKLFSRGGKHYD